MYYWAFWLTVFFVSIGIYDILKYIVQWIRSIADEYKNLNEIDEIIGENKDG